MLPNCALARRGAEADISNPDPADKARNDPEQERQASAILTEDRRQLPCDMGHIAAVGVALVCTRDSVEETS
jgi:hypothetical protein